MRSGGLLRQDRLAGCFKHRTDADEEAHAQLTDGLVREQRLDGILRSRWLSHPTDAVTRFHFGGDRCESLGTSGRVLNDSCGDHFGGGQRSRCENDSSTTSAQTSRLTPSLFAFLGQLL